MKVETVFRVAAIALLSMALACHSPVVQPQFPERAFNGPWSMDANDFERFRVGMNAVKVGDDIRQIVDKLGPPDRDYTVDKNGRNRFFTYYISRQRADSPVQSDKVVIIGFNSNNRVKAVYSNVESIPSMNFPK